MDLRPELMPPVLDKVKLLRLTRLAAWLDGNSREDHLKEFNREAGTHFNFVDFRGIYGGMDHETWVRIVLSEPAAKKIPDISPAEFLELVARVCRSAGEEHEIAFWLRLLEANVPDPRISDLICWPAEYFGDGDNARELSPKEILDIALTPKPADAG